MKNGDRLTCEVIGLESGALYLKLDYVDGTISVQWSAVARIESSRMMIAETQSGAVYVGTLSTVDPGAGQPVKIQVTESPDQKVVVDSLQIVSMDRTSEKFWQRFNGRIGSGATFSKGNQSTQYNLNTSVEYPRERWSAQVDFNSSLSANKGAPVSSRNELDLSGRRLLPWNNYFYAGTLSFLQSTEQQIDRQTNLGGGIGRYLKNTNRAKISLLGGLAWQETRYDAASGSPSQHVAAAIIAGEVRFFKFKKTHLDLDSTLFPAISDPGRVYFRTNASYYIKIFTNLSWNISFYGNWDNRPPHGLSGSDFGSTSGLSWTFGNR
jgi:hypothetical protein